MGTQQIILLTLAVAIVGAATILGIQSFNTSSEQANLDALTQDAFQIATLSQVWKQKPTAMGGQAAANKADEEDFTGLTFRDVNYSYTDQDATCHENVNGRYFIEPSGSGLTVTAYNTLYGTQAEVTVDGVDSDNVNRTGFILSGKNELGTNEDLITDCDV